MIKYTVNNEKYKGVIKPNTILINKIIDLAYQQLEKEYIHGSHGPNNFDCAGLVWYIYHEILGIDIYESGYGISTTTKIMTSKYGKLTLYKESSLNKKLKLINKGDILFFHRQSKNDNEPKVDNKYPGHAAIYIGNNEFIHATRKSKKVLINRIDDYWYSKLVGSKNIREFLD